MPVFTVITCAYNRPDTLKRLYESLKAQTYQDFEWLIIDDSTTIDVNKTVSSFLSENHFPIRYYKRLHQGKHWAQRYGLSQINTPYVVDIDDDDELTPNCLAILANVWKQIENEGHNDIGMICGLSVTENGNSICYDGWEGDYIDTDYLTMEWTRNHPSENIISRRKEVIDNVDIYCDDGKWLYDKVTLVTESVLWNRVARHYKARYLKNVLRIFHEETNNRQTRCVFNEQKCINYVFSNYVMLNELADRLWENPKDAIKFLAEYIACGIALRFKFKKLLRHLERNSLKVLSVLLYPLALPVGLFFRKKYFVSEVSA